MADPAILVENLSKVYRIGSAEERHETLSGAALGLLSAPLRNLHRLRSLDASRSLRRPNRPTPNEHSDDLLWALRDVSFQVHRGEVLGVIGRNGAGKSTLLKILSRVTSPSSGRVTMLGRVSSLLEVGTGFHPELTGRENVYLNGTILGMRKAEIDRKFDQIVDFSGVSRFLDTPVKRYSSGMKVRLAFAVAAHLEPEILIVDEVLAVGDAAFRARCVGKMQEVTGRGGRTVLFVSHDMNAVHRLCSRCLLLGGGRLVAEGTTEKVISQYLEQGAPTRHRYRSEPDPGRDGMILEIVPKDAEGQPLLGEIDASKPFAIEVVATSAAEHPAGYLTVSLRDRLGTPVLFTDLRDSAPAGIASGVSRYRVEFPEWLLAPGDYLVTVGLNDGVGGQLDVVRNGLSIALIDLDSPRGGHRIGYFGARLPWARVVPTSGQGTGFAPDPPASPPRPPDEFRPESRPVPSLRRS
ncbi:ABC transporter ATP-binding protein [Tautonia sociabilis]|uniref:ATP-binding cassette domain-containing protein n=1 Tax=Tautonia sociabilis TaxID=2080755 RepID=A0A432MIG6_9BACT|nr:polysaccharide ABC transporter ATP-binding protein [Tautonia sociabilis]RUL87162.1 ATP-binding cassette domain-containing protein [Tautonia sociabilis]